MASAAFLTKVPIFADLNEEEVQRIFQVMQPRDLAADEILFHEGDAGGELYIVEKGTMGISVTLEDGQSLEIASFSGGDFFGEMSIFEKEPRSATCCAKSRCHLYALHEKAFFELLETSPTTAATVMKQMLAATRRRLQDTGAFLSDMVQWGEEARRRAITDPLTGLYNRRYLEEALDEYFMKAVSGNRPMAVVMLDLDHFREINEGYSQEIGDKIIIAVAEVFRRRLRSTDVAARYGGDEFTVILPDTDAAAAQRMMEGVRADVADLTLLRDLGGSILQVTTSQGIACFPDHARELKGLRESADEAMYRAKELGRNRVVLAPGSIGSSAHSGLPAYSDT
jgi:diguanylate cyclase (GGDEF)-like protein